MKLELVAVGTCEICGFEFSSLDATKVQQKIKECEDRGNNYGFKFKPGQSIRFSNLGRLTARGSILRCYYEKESHRPMYEVVFFRESEDDAVLAFEARNIDITSEVIYSGSK